MPVAFIRPRRLATGAHIESGRLMIHDCVPVDGLTVGLYLTRAPWRPPVVLPVPGNGAVELPPGLGESGPVLAFLRVEDPWTITIWPAWPERDAYLCEAPGFPAGADDDEAIRRLMSQVLRRNGYRVLEASSGEEAIAVVSGLDEDLDLLVSDIVMPSPEGDELAALLQEVNPGLRVLSCGGGALG